MYYKYSFVILPLSPDFNIYPKHSEKGNNLKHMSMKPLVIRSNKNLNLPGLELGSWGGGGGGSMEGPLPFRVLLNPKPSVGIYYIPVTYYQFPPSRPANNLTNDKNIHHFRIPGPSTRQSNQWRGLGTQRGCHCWNRHRMSSCCLPRRLNSVRRATGGSPCSPEDPALAPRGHPWSYRGRFGRSCGQSGASVWRQLNCAAVEEIRHNQIRDTNNVRNTEEAV